jgi:UDP-GlcNAc:undecaprenyl-phosphate/decaprenyl-phosphate GlcNAc-1-phosphate transferase
MNAIMVIKFMQVAGSASAPFPIESAVAIGISILMVPLADTLRVFTIRISQGRSPFSPDRNHIHHLLLDRGLNHKYVTLCCLLLNIFFITLAYFGRTLGPTYLILSMVAVSLTLLGMLLYFKKPVRRVIISRTADRQEPAHVLKTPSSKVVSIKSEMAVAEN